MIANPAGSVMLFSSGDSPRNVASILSGEGIDTTHQGESPFFFFTREPLSLSAPTPVSPKLFVLLARSLRVPVHERTVRIIFPRPSAGLRGASVQKSRSGDAWLDRAPPISAELTE